MSEFPKRSVIRVSMPREAALKLVAGWESGDPELKALVDEFGISFIGLSASESSISVVSDDTTQGKPEEVQGEC